MRLSATLPTAYGRRLVAEPQSICCRSTADRFVLAHRLDREADLALSEGDYRLADILAWRAAGPREAAP